MSSIEIIMFVVLIMMLVGVSMLVIQDINAPFEKCREINYTHNITYNKEEIDCQELLKINFTNS